MLNRDSGTGTHNRGINCRTALFIGILCSKSLPVYFDSETELSTLLLFVEGSECIAILPAVIFCLNLNVSYHEASPVSLNSNISSR